MQCPMDGETLVMTARNGVEIDYCPKCRGVWLDRGELDKIIERATVPPVPVGSPAWSAPTGHPTAAPDLHGRPQSEVRRRRDRDDDDDDDDHRRRGRRDSFLSDLFDF